MSVAEEIAAAAGGLAFGIPGGGPSLEAADAIERAGGRFFTTRFEGSAALMAGAVGRLTGRPGVAVSIKGPGLGNLAAGLATATLEDLPVLAVCEAFGRGDNAAKAHKRLDHGALVGAVTKARCGIGEAGGVARLAALAAAERPGPVLLELADTAPHWPQPSPVVPRDVDVVMRAIDTARRPVVIAGGLAARKGWSGALNALSIPAFATAGAKGVIDETLPHAAGVYTGVGLVLAPEAAVLAEADLVVGLGLRTHEILGAGLKLPLVNIDNLDAAPGFSVDATVAIEDGPRILAALAAKSGWGGDLLEQARSRMRTALLAGPFLPAQTFAAVAALMPRARMVLDTGFFCTIGEHIWDVTAPELYLSSGQGRSMGAALPMAIAASLCRPAQPTILAIGDGGIGVFAAELSLAVAEKASLLVLFMRDGTYSSVRDRAVVKGLTQRPLVMDGPDWTAIAAAMGFAADRAENAQAVSAFVERWGGTGPAFLEVRFDPEPYRVMTAALRG